MFIVSEVLREKGSTVHVVSADATVLEASQIMNEHRIGSVVVTDGERIEGIFTERDILTRIVAEERAPSKTKVREVMTSRILTCTPATPLEELRQVMREHRVRHIPVVENGKLAGMVSIGDVNAAEEKTLVETISFLEAYIAQ